ncbi:TylF/MycF/NovP-related O-methyltransferase [Methylomonas sp. YC3]
MNSLNFCSRMFLFPRENIRFDKGHAFVIKMPNESPIGDTESSPYSSKIILFEDGVELWPPHAIHDDIRAIGCGLYSHYGNYIWFSSSDNSSPIDNGRRYEAVLPSSMYAVNSPDQIIGNETGGYSNLPPFYRFRLAREAYRQIWPYSRLPDIGRRVDIDQEFAADFAHVSPDADYSYERKFNLEQLFKLVVNVEGDVAECGTYQGGSAFFLARHIVRGNLKKQLFLFDSFEGLSSPVAIDGDWWKAGDLHGSVSDVWDTLAPFDDPSVVTIYQGWIPQRFTEVANRRFCFLHIDVDLAQPTLDSLMFFYPRLNSGALILFDDYGHESCPGVTQVVDAFMNDKPEPLVNLASGGAFIIKL